jgi:hypothetical protein
MSSTLRWLVIAISLGIVGFAGHALAKPCECVECECCAGSLCYSPGWCIGNQQCGCRAWLQGCY